MVLKAYVQELHNIMTPSEEVYYSKKVRDKKTRLLSVEILLDMCTSSI